MIFFIIAAFKKRRRYIMAKRLVDFSYELMEEKRAKITAQGLPFIPNDREEGVFQMVDFPYESFESWNRVYVKAAIENNKGLSANIDENGQEISILDFLDDAPCRLAYAHHLDPAVLGKRFGETFNPLDTQFIDGKTMRELLQ